MARARHSRSSSLSSHTAHTGCLTFHCIIELALRPLLFGKKLGMSAAAAGTAHVVHHPAAVRVAIIPGNGTGSVRACNFYGWLHKQLTSSSSRQLQHASHGAGAVLVLEPVLQDMPDPLHARESMWLPFMKETLHCGPDTIIVVRGSMLPVVPVCVLQLLRCAFAVLSCRTCSCHELCALATHAASRVAVEHCVLLPPLLLLLVVVLHAGPQQRCSSGDAVCRD